MNDLQSTRHSCGSYDSPPRPPPPNPSLVRKLSLFLSLPVCRRSSFLSGWARAKSYACEKAWPSINHSILSSVYQRKSRVKKTITFKFLTKLTKATKRQNFFLLLKKVIKNSEISVFGPLVFLYNCVAAFSTNSKSESNSAIFGTHIEFTWNYLLQTLKPNTLEKAPKII